MSQMNAFEERLEQIRRSPGFYLPGGPDWNGRSLHLLEAFIFGYHQGSVDHNAPGAVHPYSNHPFTEWVEMFYRVIAGPKNGFYLIREHVGGDDALAFDEFFRLWSLYVSDVAKLGFDGIMARYGEFVRHPPETT